MKAHPGFKCFKLSVFVKTLVAHLSNLVAAHQYENILKNVGVVLGEFTDGVNVTSLFMAQKGIETFSKPPKKRYLVNGEFQTKSESPKDGQECQTQDACSTLLEFAEICSSNAVRESATVVLSSSEVPGSTSCQPLHASNNKLSSKNAESSKSSKHFDHPAYENNPQTVPLAVMDQVIPNNVCHTIPTIQVTQEQPLDLCKNKNKDDSLINSKTITTSHQQLIEHFVDKFLCAKPVPHKTKKSEYLDPVLSKLFSSNSDIPCSSETKVGHTSFSLSAAIESAVDKAYSLDKKNSSVNPSNSISKCFKNDNFKLPLKNEDIVKLDVENTAKSKEQIFERMFPSENENKMVSLSVEEKDSLSSVVNNKHSNNESNLKISERSVSNSSKYFCKLLSPPKKSSVWCDLFMNEQSNKIGNESKPSLSNYHVSNFQSPARRSSQRTCKGRRYQALITEGLLQSSKERKQNNNKKAITLNNKVKAKMNSSIGNRLNSKKKRKNESVSKSKSMKIIEEIDKRKLDLEQQISSLPNCNNDLFNKRKREMNEGILF